MIFQETYDLVLSGKKTQTRRVLKPGQRVVTLDPVSLNTADNRILAYVGQVRTVQSGRGNKGERKIRITALREENLRRITWKDAKAEGVREHIYPACGDHPDMVGYVTVADGEFGAAHLTRQEAFFHLWDTIHGKTQYRAENNPRVVVYTFELLPEDSK